MMNYQVISYEEMQTMKNYILVDIREESEYLNEHINGAIHIDFEWIMKAQELDHRFSKKIPIILYCSNGGRSIYACAKLVRMGYEGYSLVGGFHLYKKNKNKDIKIIDITKMNR